VYTNNELYNSTMFRLITIILITCLFGLGTNKTKSFYREVIPKYESKQDTPLYLPQAKHLRLITFGFERFVSDIIWFRSMNYFGKQISKNKSIPWLSHMCDLVTDLNPKAASHYDFCSSLISWVAKEPEKTVNLLNRAISHRPDYWRYYYIRGFNYWYFLENNEKAAKDFQTGSKLPDAPLFMGKLASRLLSNDPNQAIAFLQNLIKNSKDETAVKALKENLKLAYVSRDIKLLNNAASKYEEIHSNKITNMSELVEKKLISFVPKDPYGDKYLLNDKGEIISQKGKKGLEFKGKTAKTGLAKF